MDTLTKLTPEMPPPQWGTTPGRWVLMSLFWLPLSLFWGAMLGQVLPAKVEAFASQGHTGTYLATISVSGAGVALLVQLVIGPLSDACTSRWGRRRPFIFWGTLLSVAALLGFAYAGSFLGLVVAFAAVEFLLNVANGPYQALIPDLVPVSRQGGASGVMGIMSLLGDAGGPLLAGLLLGHAHTPLRQAHAVQTLIWLVAALLVACMLVTVVFVPDPPAGTHHLASQGPPETGGLGGATPVTVAPLPHPPVSGGPREAEARGEAGRWVRDALRSAWKFEMRRNPDFYWLLLSRAAYNLGFYTALAFLAYYVEYSLHQGENYHKQLTTLQEIVIGGALLGTLPAAYLADRASKKRVIWGSSLFSLVAGLAFALTPALGGALKMAFLFGLGYGMYQAVDWAFACSLLPAGGGAKFMAIWSVSTMAPQLLAPAFGPVADHLNRLYGMGAGYRAAMFTIPLYVLLGLACMGRVRERTVPSPRIAP